MGLSLTTFALYCERDTPSQMSFTCNVTNTGSQDGDEVVQLYHSLVEKGKVDQPVPKRALIDFARVRVRVGGSAVVVFRPSRRDFELVTAAGRRVLYPGRHLLTFSRGHGPEPQILV